jgi:hypothetical protein
MALFRSSQVSNSALVELLIDTGPVAWQKKNALKALSAREGQLIAAIGSEEPVLLASHISSVGGAFLLITDQAVSLVTKRGCEKRFTFPEIAETKLFEHGNGPIILVETHVAQRDYMPDDLKRQEHCIQVQVPTPGGANQICSAIDSRI